MMQFPTFFFKLSKLDEAQKKKKKKKATELPKTSAGENDSDDETCE